MTCPNCGQEFPGGRCPNCGRPTASAAHRVLAVLIAIFLVLPLALAGACVVWMGVAMVVEPGGLQGGFWLVPLIIGAVVIPAFVGSAYLVWNLWKR